VSSPSDRPGPREKGSADPGRKPDEYKFDSADAGVGQGATPVRVSTPSSKEGVRSIGWEPPFRRFLRIARMLRPSPSVRGLVEEFMEYLKQNDCSDLSREMIIDALDGLIADYEEALASLRKLREYLEGGGR